MLALPEAEVLVCASLVVVERHYRLSQRQCLARCTPRRAPEKCTSQVGFTMLLYPATLGKHPEMVCKDVLIMTVLVLFFVLAVF